MKKRKSIFNKQELENIIVEAINKYLNDPIPQNDFIVDTKEIIVPDINSFGSQLSYANPDLLDMLEENLVRSYDINTVKNKVCSKFDISPNDFMVEKRRLQDCDIELAFIYVDKKITANKVGDILHFMETCGYFLCSKPKTVNNKIVLAFEPQFPKDITNEIRNKYTQLYHATPTLYVNKILKKGLIPKSQNELFKYPDRVYCMRGNELSSEHILMFKTIQTIRKASQPHDNNKYTVLKIELDKVPSYVHFYGDPMDYNAIFTYDNIPPYAIQIVGQMK